MVPEDKLGQDARIGIRIACARRMVKVPASWIEGD
jgi:hypothetical protein